MMRLQLSATKLRLSKIFRCLAVLCILKVCILAMLMLDFPLPFNLGDGRSRITAKVEQTRVSQTPSQGTPAGPPEAVLVQVEDMPQGAEAARLAAAMKPGRQTNTAGIRAELPVPSTPPERQTVYYGQTEKNSPYDSTPLLVAGAGERGRLDGGWLDMLGLNRLPIPGLGVQTVCAAGLDMPVPQTGTQSGGGVSPFTPAAQSAPVTMPGAPALPPGFASGQGAGGAPLAPRPGAVGAPSPPLPSSPQEGAASLPAPVVAPNKAPDDPNGKAQELARQQQDMLMLRQQMDQRLKDIQSAEAKMKDMLREAKGVEDKKVRSLILMYSSMKPKVAAKALESLDERIAVRLLFGMPPKQAGEILTYTEPGKTAKFTEILTRMRLPE